MKTVSIMNILKHTRRFLLVFVVTIPFLFSSCSDDDLQFDERKPLSGTWRVELLEYPSYDPLAVGTMTLDDTYDSVLGSCTIGDEEFSIIDANIVLGVRAAPSRLVLSLKGNAGYYVVEASLNEAWDAMEGIATYLPDPIVSNSGGRWLRAYRIIE